MEEEARQAELTEAQVRESVRKIEEALAQALHRYFSDPALLRRSGRTTQEAVARFGGATGRIMQALEPWLTQIQAEKR